MVKKPADTWLSWKHLRSHFREPLSLAQKVDLFYERLFGWQLHIADLCANGSTELKGIPHSGFAVLQICLSYFETLGKYEVGFCKQGASEKHFRFGLKSVFPYLRRIPPERFDQLAGHLYEAARCGLYHASQTSPGILLKRQRSVLIFNAKRKSIAIDPHCLPIVLTRHLNAYRGRLEDGRHKALAAFFEARFNYDNPGLA